MRKNNKNIYYFYYFSRTTLFLVKLTIVKNELLFYITNNIKNLLLYFLLFIYVRMSALWLRKLNILHYKHFINLSYIADALSFINLYKLFYLNKRKIIFFNIKILKMSSKFCKNQLYNSYILGFFITILYTIFYYLHYFLLFSKVNYYFVWRNLPTIVTILQKFT